MSAAALLDMPSIVCAMAAVSEIIMSPMVAPMNIMASMTFKGLFDPTEECTLKITRAVA